MSNTVNTRSPEHIDLDRSADKPVWQTPFVWLVVVGALMVVDVRAVG